MANPLQIHSKKQKADDRDRTGDLLITNQLLYQLSYVGKVKLTGPKRVATLVIEAKIGSEGL